MKGTEHFKRAVKAYLDERAESDALFAASYAKEGKNLEDCITYIINQVKASGCCGWERNEIFGLAVHFFDQDDIEVGERIDCTIVVLPSSRSISRPSSSRKANITSAASIMSSSFTAVGRVIPRS